MKKQNHSNLKSRTAAARTRLLAIGFEVSALMRMSYFELETLIHQNAGALARHDEKLRILEERSQKHAQRAFERHQYQEHQRTLEREWLRNWKPAPVIGAAKPVKTVKASSICMQTIKVWRQRAHKFAEKFRETGDRSFAEQARLALQNVSYFEQELRHLA